jgi:phospholipid/cholesterol/gamma-HCH transport system substrate-binding protein
MTGKPFKFRYTSEIAGAFVSLSVLLLVVAIFVAGHAQGWFERRFTLKTRFDTEEGAFGLQEGNEVRIRNTLAGRVGKIMPIADGSMETTFTLKERFKPFLTRDSVAKIKKKFGVAGDSYVEIEKGKGALVEDGDFIVCKKDEEIMETAKKVLNDVQAVVLPLLDETKQILAHVNGIVGSVEEGDGLAGALLKDQKLSEEVKKTIDNVNFLLQDSQEALYETTRLIKGAQKHWLVRKYMEADKMAGYVAPRRFNDVEMRRYSSRFRSDLEKARTANNSREIARNAYNLAVCLLGESKYEEIRMLLKEAEAETQGSVEISVRNRLLEAEVARRSGDTNRALEIARSVVQQLDKSVGADMRIESRLMVAGFYCDVGNTADARGELQAIASLLKKTESSRLKAMAARVTGQVLLKEDSLVEAAVQFDLEAGLLQQAESFFEMAAALEAAGRAYERAGNHAMAADRYFRAGRSWMASGYQSPGEKALLEAFAPAQLCEDEYILAQIGRFTNQPAVTVDGPEKIVP